jgi:tRNA (cmo5U34)-methyltransferase
LIKQIKEKENYLSYIEFVALDVSPTMIKALKNEFGNDNFVKLVEQDLDSRLPDLGYLDAIISSFAIHDFKHNKKYSLYEYIYHILNSGGIFYNLEHLLSQSIRQHNKFIESVGVTSAREDKTNRLLLVEKQLQMLLDIGFVEADCYCKWYEMALLIGFKI